MEGMPLSKCQIVCNPGRDSASWITHHPAIGSCIVCGFEGLEICHVKGLHYVRAVRW